MKARTEIAKPGAGLIPKIDRNQVMDRRLKQRFNVMAILQSAEPDPDPAQRFAEAQSIFPKISGKHSLIGGSSITTRSKPAGKVVLGPA